MTVPVLRGSPAQQQEKSGFSPWRWLLILASAGAVVWVVLAHWPVGFGSDAWVGWLFYLALFVWLNLLNYRLTGELLFRFHNLCVLAAFLTFGLAPALGLILVGATLSEALRFGVAYRVGVNRSWQRAVQNAAQDAAAMSTAILLSGALYQVVGGRLLGPSLHLSDAPVLTVLFGVNLLVRSWWRWSDRRQHAQEVRPEISARYLLPIVIAETLLPLLTLGLAMPFASYTSKGWLAGIVGMYMAVSVLFRALTDSRAALQKRMGEIQGMADDLTLINNTSSAINASLDLPIVMQRICQVALKVSSAQQAAIILRTEDDQQLHLAESSHISASLADALRVLLRESPHVAFGGPGSLRPLFSDDVETDPQVAWLHSLAQQGHFRALACRPLPSLRHLIEESTFSISSNGQALIGFLVVFYDRRHEFNQRELRLLDILANQAAVAIENAHLYQETQNAVRRMTYLIDSTRVFTSSLALDMVDELVVDWLVNALDMDSATLALWNRDQNELILQAHARGPDTPLGFIPAILSQPLEEIPEVGWVLRNRWSRVIESGDSDLSEPIRRWLDQSRLNAVILTPLVVRNQAIGLLALGLLNRRAIPPSDMTLIEAVANQAATAIQNAQLYSLTEASLSDRLIELSALETTLRRLSASLDLQAIIDQVLDAAAVVTGADYVACALPTPVGSFNTAWRTSAAPEVQWNEFLAEQGGVIQRVMRSGRAARIPEIDREPDYVPPPGTGQTFAAELCVPILYEGEAIGVLNLESAAPRAFNEYHLRFLENLASHAAIAIERARLYEAVRSGRDRMQAILNTVNDGLILLDRGGRLMQANPAAERLFEIDLRPLLGQHVLRLLRALERQPGKLPDPSPAKLRAVIRTLQNISHDFSKEEVRIALGGQLRFVEVMSAPVLAEEGEAIGRLMVFRDVTDARALEQARTELTNMILHDLRSPLNSIMGSIDMVRELSHDPADAPLLEEVLQIAQSGVENLLSLVESMLDVARLEENQMPLRLAALPISGPLEDAMRSMEVLAQGSQVILTAHAPDDLPPLWIDGDKIRRVIINLVDNAVRYTPAGGRVLVQVECPPEGNNALVSVIDNGPGVPPEARERIFEKFTTGLTTAPEAKRRRGIGLGLTFCRLAIEAHGGRIWVENAPPPDTGAVFRFVLPLAKEKSMMQAGAGGGQARIGDAPAAAAPSTEQDALEGRGGHGDQPSHTP